jgi:hypothetical protein
MQQKRTIIKSKDKVIDEHGILRETAIKPKPFIPFSTLESNNLTNQEYVAAAAAQKLADQQAAIEIKAAQEQAANEIAQEAAEKAIAQQAASTALLVPGGINNDIPIYEDTTTPQYIAAIRAQEADASLQATLQEVADRKAVTEATPAQAAAAMQAAINEEAQVTLQTEADKAADITGEAAAAASANTGFFKDVSMIDNRNIFDKLIDFIYNKIYA